MAIGAASDLPQVKSDKMKRKEGVMNLINRYDDVHVDSGWTCSRSMQAPTRARQGARAGTRDAPPPHHHNHSTHTRLPLLLLLHCSSWAVAAPAAVPNAMPLSLTPAALAAESTSSSLPPSVAPSIWTATPLSSSSRASAATPTTLLLPAQAWSR